MNTWNAGQILSAVRTENKMDINYLGPDDTTQNQTLFQFMNLELWSLPELVYLVEDSDVVTITSDGPVTFKKGNVEIANMYGIKRIAKIENDRPVDELSPRYSITAPKGWFCDGPNRPIDVKGANGDYKLTYIRYPRQVTTTDDPVDITEAGYKMLVNAISTHIKLVKNYYEEAQSADGRAKAGYGTVAQSALAAKGILHSRQSPSSEDVSKARGN